MVKTSFFKTAIVSLKIGIVCEKILLNDMPLYTKFILICIFLLVCIYKSNNCLFSLKFYSPVILLILLIFKKQNKLKTYLTY